MRNFARSCSRIARTSSGVMNRPRSATFAATAASIRSYSDPPRRVIRLPLPPDEDLAVRADVLVVQPPHHVAVDLAVKAERGGAGALPVAGRLSRRAGVVVGPWPSPTASVRYAVS